MDTHKRIIYVAFGGLTLLSRRKVLTILRSLSLPIEMACSMVLYGG
jgi:hypothetical protein